jgi:hypothetical protein
MIIFTLRKSCRFFDIPTYTNPINTLQDLIDNKGSLTWGILRGTALEDYLKVSL